MPVEVSSRIPEIAETAEIRAKVAVAVTADEVAYGARLNLILHGSIKSGELLGSVGVDSDGGYESAIGAGGGLPDGRAVFVELGTGVRGSEYEFPGKPGGVTYDMTWMRGIPKDLSRGFAYLIPALELQREPFEERMSEAYG